MANVVASDEATPLWSEQSKSSPQSKIDSRLPPTVIEERQWQMWWPATKQPRCGANNQSPLPQSKIDSRLKTSTCRHCEERQWPMW